jgi:hypothetical protein
MQDTGRSEVQQFLEKLAFVVEPVAETRNQKRAELRVTDADASYLIEVKTIGKQPEAHLSTHGFAESFTTLAYANEVASQVRYAVKH